MDEEEKIRLDFKQKYYLQNLGDVRQNIQNVVVQLERTRAWFISIWIGSLVILTKLERSDNLIEILISVIISFWLLELFSVLKVIVHGYRFNSMEHWITSSSIKEQLQHKGPLAEVVPPFNIWQYFKWCLKAIFSPSPLVFYSIFMALTIILNLVLG